MITGTELRRAPLIALFLALPLLPADAGRAEDDCGAGIRAELTQQETDRDVIRHRFEVVIDNNRSCTAITYDLVVEELLPNRQWKSVRKPRRVKLEGRSYSETVEHTMTADLELLGHEVKIVGCEGCSTQP